ncbi:MAG: hypothetical protein KGL77_05360 [Actinomycetales bacterium]|nr:hypothetical protein [Actinomycetales bacterium]
MILNKLKQNLAGFAVVAVAFAGFSAIAPANAVGTSVTTGQVSSTNVSRGTKTISGNTATLTATSAADDRISNFNMYISLASVGSQFALQAGDSFKVSVVYANATHPGTLTYNYMGGGNVEGSLAAGGYNSATGNTSSANGTGNTFTRTYNSTGMTAGNYSSLYVYFNGSYNDPNFVGGDQVSVAATVSLVRGGVETVMTPLSLSSGSNYFNVTKTNANATHTVVADDATISTNSDFCVYRGENGVANSTQIDVTITNSGTGNSISNINFSSYIYGGMTTVPGTTNANVRTYTLPASGWDVVRVSAWTYVNTPTVGQTYTPVLSAVIHGTSTSVVDTCSRTVPGMSAPTATANGTTVSLSWAAPSLPVSGTWDNVSVFACATSLNACGNYVAMNGYVGPNFTWVQSYNFRYSGMLQASSTSATVSAQNMMAMMGMVNQAPASWSASTDYKYFVVYEDMDSPYYAVSAVSAALNASGQAQQQVQNNSVAPALPTNVPLVAPIAVPQAGFKPGGALVLSGANMAAVTSIKVDSTATTTVKTASGIEVKVPADLAPGAHDLLVTTATGATLFVGAIKIADPAVVAAKDAVAKAAASILYRAPIDLTVGKAVTSAQAAAAKTFANQYRDAKSAVCIAIPATKATSGAALAAANKVCATFKAQIPGIKTTVVLGAPSGDKINRVSAEVQG